MPDFGRWASTGGDPSLNEINQADRFIDALSTMQPVYSTDPAEAQLAYLLSEWRDDVRDVPIVAPITASDAVDALHGGLSTGRGSRRSLAVVGSVAAAMLCVGGFGTAVYGAGPGDSLYGVRTALFGQQTATRDDQVALASAQLQEVQQLIDEGQWEQAQDKLVAVSTTVQGVDPTQSKVQLVEQWNALTYKVVEQDPAATLPPGEPLPALPSSPLTWLPVPVVEVPSEATSGTSDAPVTSDTSGTTDASVTSGVPPEVLMTTAPDTSTTTSSGPSESPTSSSTPSATTSPTTPTSPSSASTSSPTTKTTTSSQAADVPPSPTAQPPSSPTAQPPSSPTAQPPSSPAAQPQSSPAAEPPSSPAQLPPAQPRLVPSSPITPPAVVAPAQPPVTPSPPTPASQVVPPAPAQPSVAATTSTVAPRPVG